MIGHSQIDSRKKLDSSIVEKMTLLLHEVRLCPRSGCHVHVKSSYLKGNFLVVPEGLFHAKPSGSECRLQT
ncbi:hypothetical protein NC653_007140 [Populus alba x Populus x berolinensis]|uniref:Uncharacterized protein n=1 Tax=Populus alba x Populus x berolinensis TaxID=444605 RepID=A0AAD6RGR5_9ROSI|nr:hypothetical protein NC653_007140 [Populus alba x Populus x berolinensis]